MNVTIQKSDLQRALTLCLGVVERRNTIPILANVLFHRVDDTLVVVATDMDMELSQAIPASFATGINPLNAITLPAHTFADVVKKSGADKLSIAAVENVATVTAANAKFKFGTLPAEDAPRFSMVGDGVVFEISAQSLRDLIDACRGSVSHEETRYYLNGIYFERNPETGGLRAVATDGHRLAVADEPVDNLPEFEFGFILPNKAVAQLRKLVDGLDGAVDVALHDHKIEFAFGDTIFRTKLVDGQFPDYRRIIPADFQRQALILTTDLAAAVARVTTVAEGSTRSVKMEFKDETLTLSTRDANGNSAEEVLDVKEFHGAPLTIGFNGIYLAAALEIMNAETRFQFGDTSSPAKLLTMSNDNPDPSRLHLLMPMRV